jgi:hypothetical protein
MSATITENPFLFDFANNSLKFKLSGTPVAVTGKKAVTKYKINIQPRANYYLTVKYGIKKYVFYFRNTTAAQNEPYEIYLYSTTAQKQGELIKKIAQNYYIEKDFAVTVSNTLEITFTARQNGGENVILETNDTAANIQLVSQTAGVAKSEKADYKLFAKLEVTRLSSPNTTLQTPEMWLHVDAAGKAALPLALLRSYFPDAEKPGLSQKFAAYAIKNVLIKYRLVYSDYFDGLVQVQKYSDILYLVNGKVSEKQRALNRSDWECPMGGGNALYSFARPRSYGSASGLSIKSYTNMQQYAYFMFFGNNTTSQLQFRVNIKNQNGGTKTIYPGALIISNYSIVRVPLSVYALSLQNHSTQIFSYTVSVYHASYPNNVWTRTFVLQEKPFYAKEFLLQNRYGVLESFFVDNEMVEKKVDGEQIMYEDKVEIDIQDISTTYTARTGYKSDFELKLLADAIENKNNYKIVNGTLFPITILPDTLTVFDESEDLQSAEFQYVFKVIEYPQSAMVNKEVMFEAIEAFGSKWNELSYQKWNDVSIFEELENTSLIIEESNEY